MGARSFPTDVQQASVTQSRARSWIREIVDRKGSIELDIVLALGAVVLWLVAGMTASRVVETSAHVAILGLILIVPRAGILALIPLLPFQPGGLFPPHGPIVGHAIAIALSMTFRAARGTISIPVLARPAVWLAVALLAATIFQATLGVRVFNGVIPLSVLSELDQVVVTLMVFVGSVIFLRPAGVVPALAAYLLSFMTVSVVGILHFARPSVLRRLDLFWMVSPDASRFRATGVIPNANFLGLFVGMGVAWLTITIGWYVWSRRPVPALAGVVAAASGTATLLLTLSRAAIVAAGVGVAIAVARRSVRVALAMLIAGVVVAVVAYPAFLDLRLGQTFGSASQAGLAAQAESDSMRATQAVAAVKAFLDAPLLGHGFGTFSALSPGYSGQDVLTSAHNTYLKLAAEQGLVGLSLFVGLLAAIAIGLWRAGFGPWSAGLAVVGVIAAFSLSGDAMSSAQSIASGFVLIAAMLVATDAGRDPLRPDPGDAIQPSSEAG